MDEGQGRQQWSALSALPGEPVALSYDLETTGLHSGCHIVQIAIVPLNLPNAAPFVSLCCPGEEVEPAAELIHGYSRRRLKELQAPPLRTMMRRVAAWLTRNIPPSSPIVWCAHNGNNFDHPILKRAFVKTGHGVPSSWSFMDTLPMSRSVLGRGRGCSLAQLHMDLCGTPMFGAHDALCDSVALARVWVQLVLVEAGLRHCPTVGENGMVPTPSAGASPSRSPSGSPPPVSPAAPTTPMMHAAAMSPLGPAHSPAPPHLQASVIGEHLRQVTMVYAQTRHQQGRNRAALSSPSLSPSAPAFNSKQFVPLPKQSPVHRRHCSPASKALPITKPPAKQQTGCRSQAQTPVRTRVATDCEEAPPPFLLEEPAATMAQTLVEASA